MKFGLFSGILWGLDTVVLGIALAMAPYFGTADAAAFASIASSFIHDAGCAIWLLIYMGVRGRLKDTVAALKTRSGLVVMLGALLGGPIGMTGYVIRGILLGTVLAGGILMLIFLLDTRPRSPEDVMRYANLPTLAVIPANPSMNGSNPRRRKARKQ